MSKSYRRPYASWGKKSSLDKKLYVRKHRSIVRNIIKNNQDLEELYTPTRNIETSDLWSMSCDGKQQYVRKPLESDADWYKKWYRSIKRK